MEFEAEGGEGAEPRDEISTPRTVRSRPPLVCEEAIDEAGRRRWGDGFNVVDGVVVGDGQ